MQTPTRILHDSARVLRCCQVGLGRKLHRHTSEEASGNLLELIRKSTQTLRYPVQLQVVDVVLQEDFGHTSVSLALPRPSQPQLPLDLIQFRAQCTNLVLEGFETAGVNAWSACSGYARADEIRLHRRDAFRTHQRVRPACVTRTRQALEAHDERLDGPRCQRIQGSLGRPRKLFDPARSTSRESNRNHRRSRRRS